MNGLGRLVLMSLWLSMGVQTIVCAQTDTLRTHRLDGVVVVGDNRQRQLTSTSPLQAIDRTEMQHLGVVDMADALHRLPGITLRDYGGAGGMKTVSVRGFGAQHTGVSYDGILLGESQGGEIDVARYSLANVRTVKLTIGDNDDIFIPARQAASAAVLSIETMGEIPIDRRVHLTTQVKWGSFGYVSPYLRYVQRLSERLTLSVTGEYTYGENDYPFTLVNGTLKTREYRTNSRMSSGHGEVDIHWQANSRNRLWAKAYYYDNDRQLPGIVRYYTNVCGERLHDRNFFAQARWITQSRDGKWMVKANGKFNWATSHYEDTLMVDRRNDAQYWQREAYASAAVMWMPGKDWAVDYSADYIYNNLNGTNIATSGHPYRHSVLQSVTAKWTHGRWVAMGRLLGSVYLNSEARNARRLSPSLSLSYKPMEREDLYLRVSYKDIFRMPTFNENYYFHYGSTDIEPEKTRQCNIGVTWGKTWTERMRTQLTVDGYCGRVSDKIVGVPYNMFIWRTVNVGKVDVRGLDVSMKAAYRLGQNQSLELSGSYSWQDVLNHTDETSANYGKQIAYMPHHTGSLAVGWQNPWVNLSLHGAGVSSRWANNNHYEGTGIAGYWDLGLTAYRTFRRWEVRADVKNLLDKQYEIVGHYPMPGISWQVSLKYSF